MKLYLDSYFTFYGNYPHPWLELELKEATPLSAVLSNLGIPIADVHLAIVNGEVIPPGKAIISGKDEVKLFPPMDGG